LSNLYDRLKRGYVVDYFSIQAGFLKKVVLNLGDLFIMTGAVILTAKSLFMRENEENL
ncbi:MAG: signal peptidase II, partial [Hungatella hathewayi]|nr:signal peptidase II [Hungatella hathewayi]